MMQKNKNNMFYCFSPPVMALTVIIELALLLRIVFWRKPTTINILAILILFALALFQAMEFGICEGLFGVHPNVLARVGFVAITALPVLGLHLIQQIGKAKQHKLIVIAYASMIMWAAVFLLSDALQNQICGGNYVIFQMNSGFGGSYFIYYYIWLIIGTIWALQMAAKTRSKAIRSSLRWMVAGYACFTVPATIMWLFWEEVAHGLPSIMCGFAIVFAAILFTKVVPSPNSK